MKSSERPEYYRHDYDYFESIPDIDLVIIIADCNKFGFSQDKEFVNACKKELSWRKRDKQLI